MKRIALIFLFSLFAFAGWGQKITTYQGDKSLMDAGKGTFDSGTESWIAYSNNNITKVTEDGVSALKIEWVDHSSGAHIGFNVLSDINTDLTIGKTYKIRIKAKGNGVSNPRLNINTAGGSGGGTISLSTSFTWHENIIIAGSATNCLINCYAMSAGEIVWIDEWSIQEWYPDGRVIRAYDANQPLNISTECKVWLDGKDASQFTLDGTYVDDWEGKGSLNVHVKNENDDATRPTYDASTGRVTFTAANSTFLQSAAFGSALSQPNTIFVVYKITGDLGDAERILDSPVHPNRNIFRYSGNNFEIHGYTSLLIGGTTNANDNIHCGLFNGASGEYWINGILEDSGDVGSNSLSGIILGADNNVTSLFADAEIMEVIIYNSDISDRDRDVVTAYLANKWNITATTDFKGYIIRQDNGSGAGDYEDLTTYTKVDPESNFTVINDKLTVTDIHPEHTTTYLYYDFGAEYFKKNFVMRFALKVTTIWEDHSLQGVIGVSNTLGLNVEGPNIEINYDYTDAGAGANYIIACGGGDHVAHSGQNQFLVNTTYYCEVERTFVGGAEDNKFYIRVYTDSDYTTLAKILYGGGIGEDINPWGEDDFTLEEANTKYRYLMLSTSSRADYEDTEYGSFEISNVEVISNED